MATIVISYLSLVKYADVAELAASSPKCSRWECKRGEDGVAVKISVPPQGTEKFWEPQESRGARLHYLKFNMLFIATKVVIYICGCGGIGRRARFRF